MCKYTDISLHQMTFSHYVLHNILYVLHKSTNGLYIKYYKEKRCEKRNLFSHIMVRHFLLLCSTSVQHKVHICVCCVY